MQLQILSLLLNKEIDDIHKKFTDSKSAEDEYVLSKSSNSESSESNREKESKDEEDTSSLESNSKIINKKMAQLKGENSMVDYNDSKFNRDHMNSKIKITKIATNSIKSHSSRHSKRSVKSVMPRPRIEIEGVEHKHKNFPNALSPIKKSAKVEGEYNEGDSLIKIFSLQVGNQVGEDEEKLSELEAFIQNIEDEELQTELPRRIFNASRVVAHRISNLDKNEYGDYVYREDDLDDNASQRLKNASDVLKFWIDRLKSMSKLKNLMRHTTNDSQKET